MALLIILETCVNSNKRAATGKNREEKKLFSQGNYVRTQLLKQISLCTQLRKHTRGEQFVSKGQGQLQNVGLSMMPQLCSYENTRL